MRENIVCKRCGGDAEYPLRVGSRAEGDYYCSKYCMLEDNPDIVKKDKSAREWLKEARKREAVKVKMRALKKEAMEVGVAWE